MRAAATFFQLSPCKNYCYLPPDRGKREQTQSSGRIPMRKLQRQLLAVAGMLAAFAVTAPSGSAQTSTQNWPTRPVKFIVSLGAGSGVDIGSRLLADKLSRKWGQPVVIENRPGGDGVLALGVFAKTHDDHVLLSAPSSSFTAHPYLYENLPYKPS